MQSVNGMIQLAAMVLQIMRGTLEERRVRGKEGMQVKSLVANQGHPAWALGWAARGGSGVRVVTGGCRDLQGATGTVWPCARAQKHSAGCAGDALLVLLDLKGCQLPPRAGVMLPLLLHGEQLVAAPCPGGGWPPLSTSGRTHLGHEKHLPWELLLCLFGRAPFSSAFFFFLIPAFNKRPEACMPGCRTLGDAAPWGLGQGVQGLLLLFLGGAAPRLHRVHLSVQVQVGRCEQSAFGQRCNQRLCH